MLESSTTSSAIAFAIASVASDAVSPVFNFFALCGALFIVTGSITEMSAINKPEKYVFMLMEKLTLRKPKGRLKTKNNSIFLFGGGGGTNTN